MDNAQVMKILKPLKNLEGNLLHSFFWDLEVSIFQVVKEISTLYVLKDNVVVTYGLE